MASLERARAAKAVLRTAVAGQDGVCGVGLARAAGAGSEEEWLLRVNVTAPEVAVPASVDGVEVQVFVVGHVEPQ